MRSFILSSMIVSSLFASTQNGVSHELYDMDVSAGGQISLYGIGLNAKVKLNDYLGVRAGFDKFSKNDIEVTTSGDEVDTKYNFDLDLQDILIVGDYHPWKSSFRVSGGMMVNSNKLDGVITPVVKNGQDFEFEFNGHKYTTNEVGSVNTKVDWDPIAPYLGIGYDGSFYKDKGWGFTFDVGVAFSGSANVEYSINYGKSLQDNPNDTAIEKETKAKTREEIKKNLDVEKAKLKDDLDDYKILPYISLGVNYKF